MKQFFFSLSLSGISKVCLIIPSMVLNPSPRLGCLRRWFSSMPSALSAPFPPCQANNYAMQFWVANLPCCFAAAIHASAGTCTAQRRSLTPPKAKNPLSISGKRAIIMTSIVVARRMSSVCLCCLCFVFSYLA